MTDESIKKGIERLRQYHEQQDRKDSEGFPSKVVRIAEVIKERWGSDTTEYDLVNHVLDVSAQLDAEAGKIATDSEVEDILTVMEAEQGQQARLLRDVAIHVSNALNSLRDVKTASHVEPDISQGFRDLLWRAADCAQTQLETALGHVAPEELKAWLDTRS
jgi:hypothetical protein